MGAILGALIGRHLAHTEDQYQTGRKLFMDKVFGHLNNPTDPTISPADAEIGLQMGLKRGYIDKRTGEDLKIALKDAQKKWDAARGEEQAQKDKANAPPAPSTQGQGQSFGVPLANPSAASQIAPGLNAAMTQPQQQNFSPGLPPPPQAGGAVQQQQAQSAILQRLLPALLAAKAQQTGGMQGTMQGATPPGPGPGTAQVPPNFNPGPGVPAAPGPSAQSGENPMMAASAEAGGKGFGIPPPLSGPGVIGTTRTGGEYDAIPSLMGGSRIPQPAQPPPAHGPRPTGLFPYRNPPTLADVAAVRGKATAIENLPGLEQTNRLALSHQAELYQQTQAQKIAEQQRILDAITSTDEFKKAPPLQQIEIRGRIMGMVGGINSPQRLLNLPKTAMPNSSFPEGTLDAYGRELDRTPGKWSFMQQDPNTGDVRGLATTPQTTKTKLLTDAGWVQVTQDPLGTVLGAMWDVNGSPITDPRMLETIRTTMQNRTLISVGTDGKPVSVVMQIPTESRSKVELPGQRPATGTPGAVPVQGQGTPIPIAGTTGAGAARTPAARAPTPSGGQVAQAGTPKGARIVAVVPRPLTAATQRTSEFAETVQKHIPVIYDLIDKLDADGQLGVIASRWNDFMAGKVGAGDPRFSSLQTNLSMFSSALAVAHQTRGVQIMQHFKEMADAGKLTPETLKANFGTLKEWIDTYADIGKNRPGAIQVGAGGGKGNAMHNPPPKTPGGPDDLLKNLIDEYKKK